MNFPVPPVSFTIPPQKKIAIICSQFPEMHETFVIRELRALQEARIPMRIYSLKPCRDRIVHPEAAPLLGITEYVNWYDPVVWLQCLWFSVFHPLSSILSLFWTVRCHTSSFLDFDKALIVRVQAHALALRMKKAGVTHVHAHWATLPTTAAFLVSRYLKIPFSFTAHAWDIFVKNPSLKEKVREAKKVITCTDYNRRHLVDLCPESADTIVLNYHGVDVKRWGMGSGEWGVGKDGAREKGNGEGEKDNRPETIDQRPKAGNGEGKNDQRQETIDQKANPDTSQVSRHTSQNSSHVTRLTSQDSSQPPNPNPQQPAPNPQTPPPSSSGFRVIASESYSPPPETGDDEPEAIDQRQETMDHRPKAGNGERETGKDKSCDGVPACRSDGVNEEESGERQEVREKQIPIPQPPNPNPQTPPPTPQPLFLSIGRLVETKGYEDLIAAYALLHKRHTASVFAFPYPQTLPPRPQLFRAIIVGNGPLKKKLSDQIQAAGLTGIVEIKAGMDQAGLRKLYAQARAFVLSCVVALNGDRDGIPNVILEAMAMGLPVISTRISGIPEAVQDQHTGLLVRPNRPAEIADALELLLRNDDLAEKYGACGREYALKKFDSGEHMMTLVDVMKGLLE